MIFFPFSKFSFLRVFFCFDNEGKAYFECITENVFCYEILQSNSVKLSKNQKCTLARCKKSEEHSKVKTKLLLKMYLQKVKSDLVCPHLSAKNISFYHFPLLIFYLVKKKFFNNQNNNLVFAFLATIFSLKNSLKSN